MILKPFLFFFGAGFAFPVFSQSQYKGSYTLNNEFHGEAHFHYRIVANDTILDGPWSFNSTLYDTLNDVFRGYQIHGDHLRGQRSGDWHYRATQFKALQGARIEGFQLVRDASGWEYKVTGRFLDGKATGNWHVVQQTIAEGKVDEVLFEGHIGYENGLPYGNLEGSSQDVSLSGAFNTEGALHEVWVAVHHQAQHDLEIRRLYEHGVLMDQFLVIDHSEYQFQMAHPGDDESDQENWVEVPVDDRYFRILEYSSMGIQPDIARRLGVSQDSAVALVRRSNELMRDIILAFSTHDDRPIWDMLPGDKAFEAPRARIRRHPLTSEEWQALDDVIEKYDMAMDLTERLSNDPRVEVASHADNDIAADLSLLKTVHDRLKSLEPMISILKDPAFEFLDRTQVMQHITPQITYPDSVPYRFQNASRAVTADLPDDLTPDNATLKGIDDHLQQTLQKLERIAQRTSKLIAEQEQWHWLGDKEQHLIDLRDSVLDLYALPENNVHQLSFASAMEELVLQGFDDYAASPDLEIRAKKLDALRECYDDALNTYHRQARIPQRLEHLDELYTRTIFNPYTFTYMDERMKERLYNAYEEILLPLVLEDTRRNITCDKIRGKQENIVKLYQRMLDLWEKDTTDITQRLRRVSDPQAIMEIISLDLDLN